MKGHLKGPMNDSLNDAASPRPTGPVPPTPLAPLSASRPLPLAPAGFWLRVAAKLTDRVVLLIAAYAATGLIVLLHAAGCSGLLSFWLWAVALLVLEIAYFAVFTARGRQTLGYRLAGVQLLTMAQQPAGWWRSLGRATLNTMASVAVLLGVGVLDYLPVAVTRSKRALHDRLTGTQVLRLAPARPAGLLLGIVVFLVLSFVTSPALFLRAFYIPSGAMLDTLQVNDRLIADTLYYRLRAPRFQDVVIFRAPVTAGVPADTEFVKRCIGVPGDVIYAKNRQYYRNGRLLAEPYVKWGEDRELSHSYEMKIVDGVVYARDYEAPEVSALWRVNDTLVPYAKQQWITRAKPERVPPGQYLMLGDYRNNSNDSHLWGLVPRANLVGKAMLIYWPLRRMRGL